MTKIPATLALLVALLATSGCVYTPDDNYRIGSREYQSQNQGYRNWNHQQDRYEYDRRQWHRDQYR